MAPEFPQTAIVDKDGKIVQITREYLQLLQADIGLKIAEVVVTDDVTCEGGRVLVELRS